MPELSSYGGSTDEYKFKEAKPYENCDDVLMDLIRRFNITDKAALQDPELLKTIIYELQTTKRRVPSRRCGACRT